MIKIYPTLILHFSTGRQIFYVRGLIFYPFSTGTKACVTASDLIQISLIQMKTCIASRGFWAVAILKSLFCLSAGYSWLFNIWTHSCSRFYSRLTTCTCWTPQWLGHFWRGLMQTEHADWQQTHKSGNTNTNLKLTLTADTQHTGRTLPTNSTLLAAPDASTMAEHASSRLPKGPLQNSTYPI